jgi:hypothetical protein
MVTKKNITVNKHCLFTVILLCSYHFNSYSQLAYKCTYRYDTEAMNITIKSKTFDTNYLKQPLKISVGEIFYINYSNSIASFTEIYFKQNENLRIKLNKASATFYNSKIDHIYSIKDGEVYDTIFKYELPNFNNKIGVEKIGKYKCEVYEWVNEHKIKYKIWVCDKLTKLVCPDFLFSAKGGIVKVEYVLNNIIERIELESFEKTSTKNVKVEKLKPSNKTQVMMPFFNIKEEKK